MRAGVQALQTETTTGKMDAEMRIAEFRAAIRPTIPSTCYWLKCFLPMRSIQLQLLAFAVCITLKLNYSLADERPPSPTVEPFLRATELLHARCIECHSGDEPDGELDLAKYDSVEKMVTDRSIWDKVRQRVHEGDMPPRDVEPLSIDDRHWFPAWIEKTFQTVACSGPPQPGPAPLGRLNRDQYRNTLRDLLRIGIDAGAALPVDGAGGEGFDNAAETLFLSPIHGEKYLEGAKLALDYAARDESSRKQIFIARPGPENSAEESAREIITQFATKAFRRPVSTEQIDRLMAIYQSASQRRMPFEEAVLVALQAVLISPEFLFLWEPRVVSDQPQLIDAHSLANRLSYFLWNTLPDEDLRAAADSGQLPDDARLRDEAVRLLKDRRLRQMAESFVGQWLGTRAYGRQIKPNVELFPELNNDEMVAAFREEPIMVFEYILRENRSLLELIDADYTFLSNRLTKIYNIRKENLEGELNQNLQYKLLPKGHVRGGLVTMAGVLAVSSHANRTSPVLRGKWVLESLLGASPPPPPPNVPALSDKTEDVTGKTVRQRLEIHRRDPTCAACHDRLDPLGFALEHFDPIGRWREKDNDMPIDAKGELPGGVTFEASDGLKRILLERKEQFVRHLTTKMLGYALGRGLVDSDYCVVDAICRELRENNYESHRLILGIVKSSPFRYRKDEL